MTFLGGLSRDFGFDVQVGCFQISLREMLRDNKTRKVMPCKILLGTVLLVCCRYCAMEK